MQIFCSCLPRLGTQILDECVGVRVCCPDHGAEAARVVQAQRLAAVEHEIDVIMFARRGGGIDDAQTPGHAEMAEQMAVVEIENQIFGATLNISHCLASQFARQRGRDAPAQARLADDKPLDAVADEMGRDAAPGGLELRQQCLSGAAGLAAAGVLAGGCCFVADSAAPRLISFLAVSAESM